MTEPLLKSLRVERDPQTRIAEVLLLGPGKGNAMGPDFWREAPGVFEALDGDEAVGAVIVRGEGKNFSYGLDVMGMGETLMPLLQGGAGDRARLIDAGRHMQRAFAAVAACRKPVVAAIDGWCIGAGLELACAADVRLATRAAKFSLREVRLSIVSDLGGLQRLPFIVGEGFARELALTGGDYPADEAQRMGLLNRVLDDEAALLQAARALARQMASNPPLAVAATKRVMNARIDDSVARGLREALQHNGSVMQSQDFQEAVAALLEKRAPVFGGN